jgi:hypothetical protein
MSYDPIEISQEKYIKGLNLGLQPDNFYFGIPITANRKKRKKLKGWQKENKRFTKIS